MKDKEDIDLVHDYYIKIVLNGKMIDYETDNAKRAFARGLCEGIEICHNKEILNKNLEMIDRKSK